MKRMERIGNLDKGYTYEATSNNSNVNHCIYFVFTFFLVFFAPDHFIDYTNIALDDADYLGTYILVNVIGNWYSVIAILNQLYSNIYALEQALGINTAQHKAAFVEGLRPLGAGADAHSRERMTNRGEEAAFFGQCAAIAHHCKGIHLEAVVIMEAKGLVLNDALIKLETA